MKKFLAVLLCLSVMAVATACGSKEEAPVETPDSQVESSEVVENGTESEEAMDAEATDPAEGEEVSEDAQENTLTGTLEEKKDTMVVVNAQEESYAFNLAEGVVCEAEVGDTVTITFDGDITVPVADQQLTATAITAAE